MFVRRGHRALSVWRIAAVATGVCISLIATPRAADAQPTIIGFLSNFDVPNNVKDANGNPRETEGFEIQIEGVQAADVLYAFGEAGPLNGPPAPCYIRYCKPQVIPYATGVYVRWQSVWDPGARQFTSNFNIPSLPLTSAGTPPIASGVFFAGHQCWSMGLGAQYPQGGCEHFGVTLRSNPGQTTYRWLVAELDGSGQPTGVLTYDGGAPLGAATPPSAAVKSVPILAPVAQVPPAGANAGQVEAVVQAPAPAPQPPNALPHRYGIAQWVKVYKKEIDRQADLDELVGGHPNENVPGIHGGDHDVNAIAETEWKLLQLDVKNPDKGSSQLVNHGSSGSNSHSVVRRYEFYQYSGPVVPPGGTSGGGKSGGQVFSTDDQEASQCPRDPVTNECTAPGPGEVGDFIGAQNAAQNLNLNDGRAAQSITFGPLADVTYPHAPITLNATASSTLDVTFGVVGACSVAGQVLSIDSAGGCVVTASQAGDASVAPAADVLRSFIIGKAAQTITFALPAGRFTYGDAPFQITATASSGLAVSFTASGACSVQAATVTITGAGMCQVIASQAGDRNFAPAPEVRNSTTIAKAAATIAVTGYTVAYDGSSHVATGTATGVVGEALAGLDLSGTAHTGGGTYADAWTFTDATGNYNAALGNVADTIGKVDATIAVSGFSGTYDGAAHGASGTAKGVLGEDLSAELSLGGTFTNAPGGTASWSFAGDGNYNAASGGVTIAIAKANVTVSTSGGSFTFDGVAHGAVGSASVPGSFTYAFTPGGAAAPVDAGSYVVTATFTPADATNFNGGSATNTIVIGQAASTVSISCPASVVSNGSALKPCTASATGVGMSAVDLTASIQYTNNVNAGTASASVNWAGDANHTGNSATATFSITAPPPPPAVNPISPIADQFNKVGDRVSLPFQIAGFTGRDDDQFEAVGARFGAIGLPAGLEIESDEPVIKGRTKAAGAYQVTVRFTLKGVTYSRSFAWTVK